MVFYSRLDEIPVEIVLGNMGYMALGQSPSSGGTNITKGRTHASKPSSSHNARAPPEIRVGP